MLVVIANDLPPAVRGRLKLWFVEPRPNVFVSGIRDSVAKSVVELILGHCPPESGILMFLRTPEPPGYKIYGYGSPQRQLLNISGMQLVRETPGPTTSPE